MRIFRRKQRIMAIGVLALLLTTLFFGCQSSTGSASVGEMVGTGTLSPNEPGSRAEEAASGETPELPSKSWWGDTVLTLNAFPVTTTWDDGETVRIDPTELEWESKRISFFDVSPLLGSSFLLKGEEPITVMCEAEGDCAFGFMQKGLYVDLCGNGPLELRLEQSFWSMTGEPGERMFKFSVGTGTEADMLTVSGFCEEELQIEKDGEDLLVTGFSGECIAKMTVLGESLSFTAEPGQALRVRFENGSISILPQLKEN